MSNGTLKAVCQGFLDKAPFSQKTSNGSLYWQQENENLRILYSYGSHYPLARYYMKESTVIVNNTSSSVTTAKHRSTILQAASKYIRTVIIVESFSIEAFKIEVLKAQLSTGKSKTKIRQQKADAMELNFKAYDKFLADNGLRAANVKEYN